MTINSGGGSSETSGVEVVSKRKRAIPLLVLGGAVVAVLALVAATFGTARHWTVVDTAEQPETFYNQEVETGVFVVFSPDSEGSLCHKGQDWYACVDLHVASYNGACADVQLTATSKRVCDLWSDWIDKQKAKDFTGYKVSDFPYGALSRYALTDVRRVSSNDYRPAETHRATCYLGFIGECEDSAEDMAPLHEERETGLYMVVADGGDYCRTLTPQDCFATARAEYDKTCGGLAKSELTEMSWNLCLGAARELEDPPTAKDRKVGSWYSAFGHLVKVPVTTVQQVVAQDRASDEAAIESAKRILRTVLNSAEAVKMRAQYKQDLESGRTEDELVGQIQQNIAAGIIEKPTACVFLGFVYDQPDDVIIEKCSTQLEAVLAGDDRRWQST